MATSLAEYYTQTAQHTAVVLLGADITAGFQPIVEARSGNSAGIAGYEALCLTPPTVDKGKILEGLERHNLMADLDFYMTSEAARLLDEIERYYPGQNKFVTVNLSVQSLESPEIMQKISEVAERHKGRLFFEITEHPFNNIAYKNIAAFAGKGFTLCVDDLGTEAADGNRLVAIHESTLAARQNHGTKLILKLPKYTDSDLTDPTIANKILPGLNMDLIAEFVDNADDAQKCAARRIKMQGYYFDRTLSFEDALRSVPKTYNISNGIALRHAVAS